MREIILSQNSRTYTFYTDQIGDSIIIFIHLHARDRYHSVGCIFMMSHCRKNCGKDILLQEGVMENTFLYFVIEWYPSHQNWDIIKNP